MLITRFINQRITAAISAGANAVIVKPSTSDETPSSKSALITKVNKPSVSILMGKVSKSRIGLMTALAMPKNRATIRAVVKVSTSNPGTIFETIIIVRAESIQFARRLNIW